ncbi:unnamed protein product [Thelazia callipaeda]|uniref:Importin N-terminal domain-containing protein n=1 Tax=Thelazia callipaeda TaxID=103827 RepID=A0A0N5CXE7_THECL|nr:unnamed protein product [Thelazia callipaeda]
MTSIPEFNSLINSMLCPENKERREAEYQYDQIEVLPKTRFLFQLFMDQTASVEVRSLSLVLMRRLLYNKWSELSSAWSKENREQFCDQLLKLATEEQNHVLRKRVIDVIAELARSTIDSETGIQNWSGVIQFLELCASSNNATLRETGMILFENIPSVFGASQDRYLPGIKQMFQSSLLYGSEGSVRTAAVRAFVAFMCDNEEDKRVIRSLSDQIPAVIQVCQHVVATEDDDDVPLQCLGDLATSVPKALQPYLSDVFTLCSSTAADVEKDDSYRHSALEVIVSLCENASGMVKKNAATFFPAILKQCLNFMTELDDDVDEWLNCDSAEEDSGEDAVGIGESSLDRISCSLGGKFILNTFLHILPNMLQGDENWKSRHAAIMGISTVGEGCKRQMEPLIEEIVDNVVPFLEDSHPRVRYAACNALGQMSTDFSPTLQKKCHEKVVNGLCARLIDLSCPRVAAHAGAALVNFSEDCPKNIISIYLRQIMEKLEFVLDQTFKQLLERGKKLVLEQVITTIASVADASQNHFVAFYDSLMPPLKYILQNSNVNELNTLRGKTVECISLIGLAVGREKFGKDAKDIMQILLANQVQLEQATDDDPEVAYMISAWARICKVLGEEFAPYLPLVMPSVLQVAAVKPDVTLMNDEDVANQEEDPDWNFIPLGDQKMFGIKTTGLEDKATACEMLVCYARELKSAFSPYIEPVTQLMLPLLKFMFHDAVRSAAADIFPCLLECARSRGDQFRVQLWSAIISGYKEAIDVEHDREVVADQLHGIAQCIDELGPSLITQEQLELILNIINQQMLEYTNRKVEREKSPVDDDDFESADTLDDEVEEDIGVLARISDIIHCLFKAYGASFFTYFEKLVDHFTPLLESQKHYSERQWSICVFDDLIEYGGEASIKYYSSFYGPMIAALSDEFPEVRQSAAYGFGVMGQHGGNIYAQACAGALPHLANMISREDARSTEEGNIATENAISAVAKILKYNSRMVDVNAVIPTFLSWLPIWEDPDETPHVYGYFADLIESNNPFVLGENNSNLPRLLTVIVEAFEKGAFDNDGNDDNVKQRLINILKFIQVEWKSSLSPVADKSLFDAVIGGAGLTQLQITILHQLLA